MLQMVFQIDMKYVIALFAQMQEATARIIALLNQESAVSRSILKKQEKPKLDEKFGTRCSISSINPAKDPALAAFALEYSISGSSSLELLAKFCELCDGICTSTKGCLEDMKAGPLAFYNPKHDFISRQGSPEMWGGGEVMRVGEWENGVLRKLGLKFVRDMRRA